MLTRAAVSVIVVLLAASACGGDAERDEAEQEIRDSAGYYCTLDYSGSISDPEFDECVDDRTESQLEQWENRGRPDVDQLD